MEGRSADDTTTVDVEGSSRPILKVLLGVTSLIEESAAVIEEAGVEIVYEVRVVVVGVLIWD